MKSTLDTNIISKKLLAYLLSLAIVINPISIQAEGPYEVIKEYIDQVSTFTPNVENLDSFIKLLEDFMNELSHLNTDFVQEINIKELRFQVKKILTICKENSSIEKIQMAHKTFMKVHNGPEVSQVESYWDYFTTKIYDFFRHPYVLMAVGSIITILIAYLLSDHIKNFFGDDANGLVNGISVKLGKLHISESLDLKTLNRITNLQLSGRGISDISQIVKLKNLRVLNLELNSIENFEPLNELKQLKSLNLSNTLSSTTNVNTYDICSSLTELPYLEDLDLSSNEITDIGPLENLSNLQKLNLSDNRISDIFSLDHFYQLKDLNLDSNKISDLSPLQNLKGLKKVLLRRNQVSDLHYLRKLTNLTHLDLSYNKLEDIYPLNTLINLKKLDIYQNPKVTRESIEGLKKDLGPHLYITY